MYSNPSMNYPYLTPSSHQWSIPPTYPTNPSFTTPTTPSFPSFPWELFSPYYTNPYVPTTSPSLYPNHGYSPHPPNPNPYSSYSTSHYSYYYNHCYIQLHPTITPSTMSHKCQNRSSTIRDFKKYWQASLLSFKKSSQKNSQKFSVSRKKQKAKFPKVLFETTLKQQSEQTQNPNMVGFSAFNFESSSFTATSSVFGSSSANSTQFGASSSNPFRASSNSPPFGASTSASSTSSTLFGDSTTTTHNCYSRLDYHQISSDKSLPSSDLDEKMESDLEPTNLVIKKSCIAEEDLEESSDPDSRERIDETSFHEATLAVEVFGAIGSLAQFPFTGAQKDFIVVGSDSDRIVILDYNKEKNVFDKIHKETFPGQYISVDPKGRAVMIGASEKQSLVYVLNRDIATRLTISLSLEAHKWNTLVFSICGVDCGFESPILAAIELDYSEADEDSTGNVKTGEMFRVEMVDWTGDAIEDDNSTVDIKHVDLSNVQDLSEPIRVVDNEGLPTLPGDLLAVEICNLGLLPGDEWGFTATFDRDIRGSFLTDHFPHASKAIWYFEGTCVNICCVPSKAFLAVSGCVRELRNDHHFNLLGLQVSNVGYCLNNFPAHLLETLLTTVSLIDVTAMTAPPLTTITTIPTRYSASRLFTNIIFRVSYLMYLMEFELMNLSPYLANMLLTVNLVFDPGPPSGNNLPSDYEDIGTVGEQLADLLLLEDELDDQSGNSKKRHGPKEKDARALDSRGKQLPSQRARTFKRQMMCRRNIDSLNVPFLAIYESLIPPEEEKLKQKQLLGLLEKLVCKEWPMAQFYLYGLCANSIGVSKSDIDVCLSIQEVDMDKSKIIMKLAGSLQSDNLQNVQALTRARDPIVTLMDSVTGISCDIGIHNLLVVVNTKLLQDYANSDTRLGQLAFIIKHWAKSRGVNETYLGTLSSYAYVLMCIHLLQQRRPTILPCLHGMDATYSAECEEQQICRETGMKLKKIMLVKIACMIVSFKQWDPGEILEP